MRVYGSIETKEDGRGGSRIYQIYDITSESVYFSFPTLKSNKETVTKIKPGSIFYAVTGGTKYNNDTIEIDLGVVCRCSRFGAKEVLFESIWSQFPA